MYGCSYPITGPGGVSTLICCLLANTGVGPRLLVGCFVRAGASSNKITKSPACTFMKKKKSLPPMGSGYNILLEKSQRYPLSPKSQKSYPSTPVEGFCWDRVFPPDNTLGFSPPLGPAGVISASAIIAEASSPGSGRARERNCPIVSVKRVLPSRKPPSNGRVCEHLVSIRH